MKIYILRHEDRTQDATFFSPLTKIGLENSIKLIDVLDKLNIKTIYSSPFIRTLQTVYPFAKKNNMHIKIDYALQEIKSDYLIPKNSHATRLPEYLNESFLIENNNKTSIETEDIKYPEKEIEVQLRIKNFLKNLVNQFGNTNDNFLLVSHQIVCNIILKIINKYGKEKIPTDVINNYPKGAVTLVLDNLEWVFSPINWKTK